MACLTATILVFTIDSKILVNNDLFATSSNLTSKGNTKNIQTMKHVSYA